MSINIIQMVPLKEIPGKGGYGVVLISGKLKKEFSQGFKLMTTNNRMELLAVIIGLESLKKTTKPL